MSKAKKRFKRFKRPGIRRGLTAYLFVPALAGIFVLFVGYCSGVFSWRFNLAVSIPLYWYCYMTAHDSIHRAAHPNLVLNNTVGWISNGLFALPFSLMRRAHLSHHRNEGKDDVLNALPIDQAGNCLSAFSLGTCFSMGISENVISTKNCLR